MKTKEDVSARRPLAAVMQAPALRCFNSPKALGQRVYRHVDVRDLSRYVALCRAAWR